MSFLQDTRQAGVTGLLSTGDETYAVFMLDTSLAANEYFLLASLWSVTCSESTLTTWALISPVRDRLSKCGGMCEERAVSGMPRGVSSIHFRSFRLAVSTDGGKHTEGWNYDIRLTLREGIEGTIMGRSPIHL